MNAQLKAVGFVRVSTESQSEKGIPQQVREIIDFCTRHELELVGIFGEPMSGMRPSAAFENAELRAALTKAGESDALIVVTDVSRLGRNSDVGKEILRRELQSISVDTGKVMSRRQLLDGLRDANRAGRKIQERTRAALSKKRTAGAVLGNPRLEKARVRAQIANRSNADARAEALNILFRQLDPRNEMTRAELAAALNARGHTTPRGHLWTKSRIRRPSVRARTIGMMEAEPLDE